MKTLPRREGVFCALWIPVDAAGRVQWALVEKNLERLRAARVHGLMVLGSTGEFLHLDFAQRMEFLAWVGKHASDFNLMANVSELNPRMVREMGRAAAGEGFDCVSILPPWFFPLSQDDIAEFFLQTAGASGLPVWLYNFPERTGHRIELETIRKVAANLPLAGVKQSGADSGYHADLARLGQELGYAVLTGSDTSMGEAMELGAVGSVSGLSNALPELVMSMFEQSKAEGGRKASRSEPGLRLAEVGSLMGRVSFPLSVAAAIEARGLDPGHPKTCVSSTTSAAYRALTEDLRSRFRTWGLV